MALNGQTKHDIVTRFRNAQILEAARKIFAQHGFEAASVEAIAQEAGIAKGTLYLYYRSKTEIYRAALRDGVAAFCLELKQRVEAAVAVEDKIRAFVTTKLSYFEDHRDFFRIYYAEFVNAMVREPEFQKEFREPYFEQLSILEAALVDGVAQGRIRATNPHSTACAVYDVVRGAITQRLLGCCNTRIQDDINFLCDFIWRGIACQ